MRDPIMRSWCAVMKLRQVQGLGGLPSAEKAISAARTEGIWARSLYSNCIDKPERAFGRDRLL